MIECDECGREVENAEECICPRCGEHIAGSSGYLPEREELLAVISQHGDGCPEAAGLIAMLPKESESAAVSS